MGYYNQALTDYVGKICDVERELYTTQRLIANLDYQMQRLGHPREVDPPEPTDGGNPFVQNGGWYMVFLLGIPISGVVRSISLGIVIAIALGVFGTVWGNIYQRAADREIRNEKWAKYDSAVAADKKRVEKERAYRKQLQSEKELFPVSTFKTGAGPGKTVFPRNDPRSLQKPDPHGLFPPLSLNGHYEHTGRKERLL